MRQQRKKWAYSYEKVRPGLGNRVIHKDFYERGRYVAYNRDVRCSPTHSELSDCTVETLTAKVPSYCKSGNQRGQLW